MDKTTRDKIARECAFSVNYFSHGVRESSGEHYIAAALDEYAKTIRSVEYGVPGIMWKCENDSAHDGKSESIITDAELRGCLLRLAESPNPIAEKLKFYLGDECHCYTAFVIRTDDGGDNLKPLEKPK